MLLDDGLVAPGQQIVVLQPRRLAARLLAKRIAHERGGQLGGEVGYHIRFDRNFGPETRIKLVTEGVLLRQMLSEPTLPKIGAVIFDEFHERHLYSDLGIAMIRKLQETIRPDLKIVVMSATLDTDALADYLEPAEVLSVESRAYPLTIEYSAGAQKVAGAPVWEQAAHHFDRLAKTHDGDCLIFMSGAYEIRRTVEAIQTTGAGRGCLVFPLYGELPPDQQDAAVAQYDQRKVVVATNVAETSITIDGIRLVIDSGLARIARYDAHRGVNTLLIEKISRASADQRAGRAGRTAPGHVLRLWSENEHAHREERETAEIRRVDLSETLLSLGKSGITDFRAFPWFERPTEPALKRGIELLWDLGALRRKETFSDNPNEEYVLTDIGRKLADFPLHPRWARLLLAAHDEGCVWHAALLAAFAQGRAILLPIKDRRQREERESILGDAHSDFFHWLSAWGMARKQNFNHGFCRQWGIHANAAREADHAAEQFRRIAEGQGLNAGPGPLDEDALRRCLLMAFSDHLAKRDGRGTLRCSIVHGRRGELRRESAARDAELFVAAEIDEIETRGEVNIILSLATEIEEEWLQDIFPDDFVTKSDVVYDKELRRVVRREERRFRDLVLSATDRGEPSSDEAAALLAREIVAGKLELKRWTSQRDDWIKRVNFASQSFPELEIEPIDADARAMILEQFCYGCVSYKDIRDKDPWPFLKDWLTGEQLAALNYMAPETFDLPNRRKPASIRYEPDAPGGPRAVISSKLQDFYDVDQKILTLGGGRIPMVIEMLAPNGRPCQITEDLVNFWKTSYEGVKKELRGRYPKHEWR
ncbi:ATP-dependent helicase HrpB [Cerasicoccus arenae]|uniref:ATP-dependent helicase HrpB n=2 Tax=Cerasicoccus arenae TaxID=424488 RepID=A0A8J3DAJ4_9BACT|nr:ATP-dependent helicase HrpB [Cerasicoccus arenae]